MVNSGSEKKIFLLDPSSNEPPSATKMILPAWPSQLIMSPNMPLMSVPKGLPQEGDLSFIYNLHTETVLTTDCMYRSAVKFFCNGQGQLNLIFFAPPFFKVPFFRCAVYRGEGVGQWFSLKLRGAKLHPT